MKEIYKTNPDLIEAVAWMRSRPQVIKDLMLKFPPVCTVKANRPLDCPQQGKTGEVISYHDDGTVSVGGVSFIFDTPIKANCKTEWLEVVGYYTNTISGDVQDEAWVREVLEETV